ncbi:LmeA family phospholipid-binding protein [Corynebacterium auris]|uniref:LmeA family phospholipid-binding protein n=1 Tax=Corynebacterium auris TaxID=44750 RepID=UPI0025B46A28|nr:DUF2993 domain-containing protein [Corynebacterium auris]WJY68724.1 hypothetical protein CAURIS_09245 [Corynebacterium auris]
MNTVSSRRKTSVKPLWVALAVIAGAVLLALAADTALASRAENRLSQRAQVADGLPEAPEVYIAGFPFLASLLTNSVPRVSVTALDAPVEGIGIVNATAEAIDIDLAGGHALNAEFEGGEAATVRRRVRLDGVALGELLGMTDLDISNPYDISPRGGPASEVLLTATPPGMAEQVRVVATLRLVDGVFHMRPSTLDDAPSGADTDSVLSAFTLTLDTRDLPLGGPADLVQVSGGSIEFSRDQINVTLSLDDLSPLARSVEAAG